MSESSLQTAFRRALLDSGVKTKASIHTLRHIYVRHLLEEGVGEDERRSAIQITLVAWASPPISREPFQHS